MSQTGEPRRQLGLFAGGGGQARLDRDPLEGRRPPAQPRRPVRRRDRGKVPRVRPLKTWLGPRQEGRRRRRRRDRSRSEGLWSAITPVRRSGSAPARELEHFEGAGDTRSLTSSSALAAQGSTPLTLWLAHSRGGGGSFQISCTAHVRSDHGTSPNPIPASASLRLAQDAR